MMLTARSSCLVPRRVLQPRQWNVSMRRWGTRWWLVLIFLPLASRSMRMNEGIGLRQLVDYYYVLISDDLSLIRDRVQKELKELGLWVKPLKQLKSYVWKIFKGKGAFDLDKAIKDIENLLKKYSLLNEEYKVI